MATSFDIKKIFQDSWGYHPPVFDVVLQSEQSLRKVDYFAKGLFGRPYFMPVKLGDVHLPNPVIKITSKKTIVETAMVGRTGTVKELISQENYRINIKGIIITENNNYPESEIQQVHDLYKQNTSFPINSALTDIFLTDDNKVVITDISWPEIVGVQNVKTYEMNLVSDHPFELILT
ncbi:MAG TPA: DUF6046 domain-containing protein [Chitinophaga sp.]